MVWDMARNICIMFIAVYTGVSGQMKGAEFMGKHIAYTPLTQHFTPAVVTTDQRVYCRLRGVFLRIIVVECL